MRFGGICITTDNAQRLAAFYKTVFQEEPFVEGSHYSFNSIAIYDPGAYSFQFLDPDGNKIAVAQDRNGEI